MASNTSKTARASVRAGQAGQGGALSVLGEFKYLIPLNGGKHAYVRNLTNGKTVHLSTDSDAFVEEIRVLAAAGHAAKIRAELDGARRRPPGHGWDATEKRLVDGRRLRGLSPPPPHTANRPPGLPGGRFRVRVRQGPGARRRQGGSSSATSPVSRS